jgi:SNF2 family DNA or RNA helicase
MGKTIQTIATILDHRPKLQHTKPRMKHPHTAPDLKERQEEDLLWGKAEQDWATEMELLKVPKKFIRSSSSRSGSNGGGGGARAGTLVICPVVALTQWKTEIEKFTDDGSLTVCTYHGPDRASQTPRELMRKYDVVLTTYQGKMKSGIVRHQLTRSDF